MYCKECWRAIQRDYYQAKKNRPKIVISEKICSTCCQNKSVADYSRSCVSRDGYLGVCNDCDLVRRGKKGRKRLTVPVIVLTETQAAYLAGLLDGEGHITIIKSRRSGGLHKGNHYAYARMSIGITHDVLVEMQAEYGFGKIYHLKSRNKKHKNLISWSISSNIMRAVLPQVLPYLRVKKKQAELVLQYLSLAKRRDRTQKYRDDVDAIHSEIRSLNKRGV
jgi:hypothetical protein